MHFPKSPVQRASPWAPSSHQAHTITVPRVPRTRPRSLDTVTPGGAQRCRLQETLALRSRRSRRFPVPGRDRPVRVSAFAPAAWITLLFLSRLLFAADGGERGVGGGPPWGMGAEGSWTPINPEKKKVWQGHKSGGGAGGVDGLAGVCSALGTSAWRAVPAAPPARALPGAGRRPSGSGGERAGGGGGACGGGEGECVARASERRRIRKSPRRSAQTCLIAVT